MKKFKDFLNESIKDVMLGKSEEEVKDAIKNMSIIQKYLNKNVPEEYRPTKKEFQDYIIKVIEKDDIIYNDNLMEAMFNLQEIIGIGDGGVCGIYFSKFDDEEEHWSNATEEDRKKMIFEYIELEKTYG